MCLTSTHKSGRIGSFLMMNKRKNVLVPIPMILIQLKRDFINIKFKIQNQSIRNYTEFNFKIKDYFENMIDVKYASVGFHLNVNHRINYRLRISHMMKN